MSEHCAQKDFNKLGETLSEALRMVLFIVTPASVGLIVLAHPIVKLLFEHGQFTPFATSLTARALCGYSAGLVAYSSAKILANAFYALQEPKIPVRSAAVCMLFNVFLILILMKPFGVAGLAGAAALSSWLNASWLFWVIRKRLGAEFIQSRKIVGTGLKAFICSGAMGLFLWLFLRHSAELAVFWRVLAGVLSGGAVFLICAKFTNMDERKTLYHMLGIEKYTDPGETL